MLRLYPYRIQKQEVQELYANKNVTKTLTFLRNLLKEVIIKTFEPKNSLVKKANHDLTYCGNNALEMVLKISRENRLQNKADTNYNILSVIEKYILKYPIIDILKYVQKYRLSVKEYLRWVLELMQALLLDLPFIRATFIYSLVYRICFLIICFILKSSIIILIDNFIDLISKSIDIIIDRKKIEVKNLDKLKLYNDFKKMVKNLIFLMLLLFISDSILKFFIPFIMGLIIYFYGGFDAFDRLDNYLWHLFPI